MRDILALDNPVNATGSEGNISLWAIERRKGGKLREI